jgi:hypothetical protein
MTIRARWINLAVRSTRPQSLTTPAQPLPTDFLTDRLPSVISGVTLPADGWGATAQVLRAPMVLGLSGTFR